jgi:hypothetical protein
MKLNFLPRLQMDLGSSVSSLLGAGAMASPIGMGASLLQTGFGVLEGIGADQTAKRLRSQRKAFETTDEVYNIVDALSNRASQGYDAQTLSYLNDNLDRSFTDSANTALRFGGDPNTVADLFDSKMRGIMKIGADNHALNMENYSKWLSAVDMLGKNKEAEWASEQSLLKDDLQAANQKKKDAFQNIFGGINGITSLTASGNTMKLFDDDYINKIAAAVRNQTTGGVVGTSGPKSD